MKNNNRLIIPMRAMVAVGGLGALLLVILRVWVVPAQRDIDTGLFTSNIAVMGLSLALLAVLGILVFLMRGGPRREIVGKPAVGLSAVLLIVGGFLLLHGIVEVAARLGWVSFYSVDGYTYADEQLPVIQQVLPWIQSVLSVLGGVSLVRCGLTVASEGGTRRGISRLGLMVPVLWMWFVLANYMISYISMVRITDGFYTLAMYITELLFLFRFAGYMAGVGKNGVGVLLFYSGGAALFALSAPLVRLLMHLLQDAEAAAIGAAGPLDLAVGVLALTVSITLYQSVSASPTESEEESAEWTDPSEALPEVELISEADAEDFSEE